MTSRRGAAPVPFVFLSLRFARGHERWLVSIRLSRVSLRLSSRLIRPVFFLIVIGAGSEERGGAVGSGRGSLFLPVARAFYSRIAIGSAGCGGEARDDERAPFYPARFLLFTVSELMPAV